MFDFLVPSINTIYNRNEDDVAVVKNASGKNESTVKKLNRVVSSASVLDDAESIPKHPVGERAFRLNREDGSLNWIGLADKFGVDTRHHLSGSVALSLSVITGLLHNTEDKDASLFKKTSNGNIIIDADRLKGLTGSLFIATYLRADFHTFAETAAGVIYFISQQIHKSDDISGLIKNPLQLYEQAIDIMVSSVAETIVHDGKKIYLRDELKKLAREHVDEMLVSGNKDKLEKTTNTMLNQFRAGENKMDTNHDHDRHSITHVPGNKKSKL